MAPSGSEASRHMLNRLAPIRAGQHGPQPTEAIVEKHGDARNLSQVAMSEQVYGIVELWNGADHPYEVFIQVGERCGQGRQPAARFHGEQHAGNVARLPRYARLWSFRGQPARRRKGGNPPDELDDAVVLDIFRASRPAVALDI